MLPVTPGQKSPPLFKNWPEKASSDPEFVQQQWSEEPNANVAIATGQGLLVLETDIKDGINGEVSLAEWSQSSAGGEIPKTRTARSGSGGIHRYFYCNSRLLRNRVGVLPGVDIRAVGGYVVAPPSLHPNGERYKWIDEGEITELTFELFCLIVESGVGVGLEVPEEVIEGERNSTLFRLGCNFRHAGLNKDEIYVALQEVNKRCTVPLDDSELELISRQAAKYQTDGLPKGLIAKPGRIFSAQELMGKQFRPLVQPVNQLICEGLSLLVAASKLGKSWLVLLMALCVAEGKPFLGRQTTKCRVLYYALEDSDRRLQSRLSKLSIDTIPDNLFLSPQAARLGEGFEEALDAWLEAENTPTLVIIDTLQKIRGVEKSANAYQLEYEAMGRLKRIADRHRASILCVHHTNKAKMVTDPYDKISGSMALMGSADTTLLLNRKRGEDTATITYTGRDVWGDDMLIRFANGEWILVSDNAEAYEATAKYANEPLAQLFRLLADENPQGGRWTYGELQAQGLEKLGATPFVSGRECGKRLADGLADELMSRDGLIVEWGAKLNAGKGVRMRIASKVVVEYK